MNHRTADIVVLGLGSMGAASLFQLAARGADVLGIDQFRPPHALGSSHGETRITRLAVAEGVARAPLVRRSHELWVELEERSSENLFRRVGFLAISSEGPRPGPAISSPARSPAPVPAASGELIGATEACRRYPWLNVSESDRVYLAALSSGYVS